MEPVLEWGKPPKARSGAEHNQMYQSDGGVPGTFVPNTSAEWERKWKAKRVGKMVQIRKTFWQMGHHAQMLMVVTHEGCTLSLNGKAALTHGDWESLQRAYGEALEALRATQGAKELG